MSDLATRTVAGSQPAVASRFATALDRMAGRLADALASIGSDETAVQFLQEVASGAPASLFAQGSCVDLPVGGGEQPIDRLASRLAPAPFELDLLVLTGLAHHHEAIAAILRSLHPEARPWPTVGLAGVLAELGLLAGGGGREDVRTALDRGVLARSGAIVTEGQGPYAERSIFFPSFLFEALAGMGGWPAGARPDPRPIPDSGFESWFGDPAVRAGGTAVERLAPVVVVAAGDRPDALAGRLAALVREAGRRPAVLHVPALEPGLVAHLELLALVRGQVPVIWSAARPADTLAGADLGSPLLLALPTSDLVAWPRPVLRLPAGPLERADRIGAIAAALPELGPLPHPIGPATVEPGEIMLAAHDVRAKARIGRLPIDRADLTAIIDARTSASVPAGAVLVHPTAGWDDLVLLPDRRLQLREAVARIQEQGTVFRDWGFLPGRTGRAGLRLLFCGPPGTGKTLAAEVIAATLGRDLLVVDLSRMVSKWIGETEKNLAAAFEAAERDGAVLFFDEADALFGKRTEVGDARDRYANLETAYLLSRLERFDGVAVLATNLRQNLDAAFARRIEFIVPFDMPDVAEREVLWRRHLPATAPVAPSVDCARLAAIYELPGALIRNAAVAAAFLAASERAGGGESGAAASGTTINLRHLVHAVRREYVKAGQAFPGAPSGVPA